MKQRIFISRDLKSDSVFKEKLEAAGYEVYGTSLLDFQRVKFNAIPEVDWIFFYSQKGVQFFFDQIRRQKIFLSPKIKYAGFGEKTSKVIESYGILCDFVGTGNVATTAPNFIKIAQGGKVLFPRAQNSQRSVQVLLENEIITHDLIVYVNTPKQNFDIPASSHLVFMSPLNANAYFEKYKLEKNQKVFAIGQTTADALLSRGIKKVICPKKPSEEQLVKLLLNYI
ncbi:MAG: uroporphyrinogen-III synthase [Bacteroidota bacterium]